MRRLGHYSIIWKSRIKAILTSLSVASVMKAALAFMILLSALSAIPGAAAPAAAGTTGEPIPQDAIRIRILANSDSDYDQRVKRDVQSRVAAIIRSWGAMPATHEEAYALIESHLADIQETTDDVLTEWNVSYGAKVELSEVPFPKKSFGGIDYDAGEYEALRISLGGGQGANWWCVLFPPLCLTAATAPDQSPSKLAASADAQDKKDDEPKARFFLWELLRQLGEFLRSIFS